MDDDLQAAVRRRRGLHAMASIVFTGIVVGCMAMSGPVPAHAQDRDENTGQQAGAPDQTRYSQVPPDTSGDYFAGHEVTAEQAHQQAAYEQAIADARRRKQRIQERHAEFRDWATLVVIVVGTIINGVLWLVSYCQFKVNKIAADAARVGAEAAERQSKLLTAQELPVIRFEVPLEAGVSMTRSGVERPDTEITYRYANYGRTPALVISNRVMIGTGHGSGRSTARGIFRSRASSLPATPLPTSCSDASRSMTRKAGRCWSANSTFG